MMNPVRLSISSKLVRLVQEIADQQAGLIGADPKEAYENYYLDIASHCQALHPVGAGLGIDDSMSVLEVGSGIGTRCLLGTGIFGATYTGLEPCANSYSMLGQAITEMMESNPHLGYRYVNRSGEDTGLPSHSFDVILCFEVMEHVQSPELVLREMYRLLKPGGRVFISTCNYDSFYEGHYRCLWLPFLNEGLRDAYIGLRGYNGGFLRELNFLTKTRLVTYLADAGFVGITQGIRFQPSSPPGVEISFPEGYAPASGRLRRSLAARFVGNRAVNAFLSRFDREYKLYIEASK